MSQEQLQQLQMLQQQMQEIQEYLMQLEQTQNEIKNSKQALSDLEEMEEGAEILAPIGTGAYVKAELKENSEVVTNIGGEVFEHRGTEAAEEILEKQIGLVKDTQEELEGQMTEMQQQMQQIQAQMQQSQQGEQ